VRFRATLEAAGKTATGIEVPGSVVEGLGAGKRPAVVVTVNGYSYRSSFGSMGGRVMLPVSAEHRAGARVSAGDVVDVEVALDAAPRKVDLPDELAAALAAEPTARAAYDALSHSRKRQLVDPIGQAKTPETRQRRIDKVLDTLRGG
jgi:hypothetical protein